MLPAERARVGSGAASEIPLCEHGQGNDVLSKCSTLVPPFGCLTTQFNPHLGTGPPQTLTGSVPALGPPLDSHVRPTKITLDK